MSTYPLEMGTLLNAMKDKLVVASNLNYLGDVCIRSGPWYPQPCKSYSVYLQPLGSPETDVTERSRIATHNVMIDAVKVLDDPFDEGNVVGRTDANVGITTFASDLKAFFDGNFLGLENSGMNPGWTPEAQVPANGYMVVEADDGVWLQSVRLFYQAQTRPFEGA